MFTTTDQALTMADLRDLAEDLHILIATEEYTRDRAITLLALMRPGLGFDAAERVLRSADPAMHAGSWDILPNGDLRPRWGTKRVIWDYTKGDQQGVPALPALVEKWGAKVAEFAPTR
ncbi:hypothetical protein [Planomonospora sp. ID82291]|uniref:hypothetical protein n=1 Tax=Planomonospora sp. ID82291 TaxID=2738136 RepID=UPI0018C42593|nr:hypothetical protein [Planomonospora sp. ID82291]MBG0818910.1 hypothetical protein [Planomonospora sp. ID82291]